MDNSLKTASFRKNHLVFISALILTILFSLMLSGCLGEDWGTKINFGDNNELYYTKNVSLEEAKSLGNYLVEGGFFVDDDNDRSVQLNKSGSTYEVRMVVKKGLDQDQDTIDVMGVIAGELSKNVFDGETVDIHLCDENFKTLRVVLAK